MFGTLVTAFIKKLMMKIVCISSSFIPSTAANSIQVVKATHALAELGHEVTLLVPGQESMSWDELKSFFGVTHFFDIQWIPENLTFKRYDFAFKAVQKAIKMKPDLVYTWVLQAGVFSLWRKMPTIYEMHDRVTGRFGPGLFRMFLKFATRSRIVAITDALRKIIISDYHLHPDRTDIVIAPDGVDLERYQNLPSPAEARKSLGLNKGITVGYTGHLYSGRGIELMFDLAKAMPNFNFLWVGGNPESVTVWKNRLEQEGVNNIKLTGFVDNALLPQYQAAAEILLMPYEETITVSGGGNTADIASPMKMFEYMAAGRPIISSDLPVIHEVLDETMAVFCPPGDIAAWRDAIIKLKENPSQRHIISENARKAVKAYTWRARSENALANFLGDFKDRVQRG